jgi:YVTN family beta-propeller protein
VAGHNSNSVSIIDTTTNKLISTLIGFQDPTGVGYNSATGNIYVGNQGTNYVSILSGSTNKVIGNVTVEPHLRKSYIVPDISEIIRLK